MDDDVVYRQDAIDAIRLTSSPWLTELIDPYRAQVKALKELPSARRKGHWVENHDSDRALKCSECGCGYTDCKLSFCYDCGADMRGEDDG